MMDNLHDFWPTDFRPLAYRRDWKLRLWLAYMYDNILYATVLTVDDNGF